MSSHRMSASGDRPYTLNAGGGAYTALQVPSKGSDGFTFNASGFSKIEIPLNGQIRLERHRVKLRGGNGETWHDVDVLVIEAKPDDDGKVAPQASVNIHGYARDVEVEQIGGENTNLDIRKPGDRFGAFAYYEDGHELVSSVPLSDVVMSANASGPAKVEAGEEFPEIKP